MPSWPQLLTQFTGLANDEQRNAWVSDTGTAALRRVAELQQANVIFYASAFLQKPQVPAPLLSLTHEDVNGLMSVVHGMDRTRPLALMLHTPGGSPEAAESIVDYIRSLFQGFQTIVPTFAFSAGTMVALGSDRIIMGRQSQLGPIDPQFVMGPLSVSAQAVVDQFEMAKAEIVANPMFAHAWAPILASIGPALLQQARNALTYGETTVASWLERYMFKDRAGKAVLSKAVAKHFNDANLHRSHGARIDRDDAEAAGVATTSLEANQELQEDNLREEPYLQVLLVKQWRALGKKLERRTAPCGGAASHITRIGARRRQIIVGARLAFPGRSHNARHRAAHHVVTSSTRSPKCRKVKQPPGVLDVPGAHTLERHPRLELAVATTRVSVQRDLDESIVARIFFDAALLNC
jgi:hypothetical protein